jgi:hypothetical protein
MLMCCFDEKRWQALPEAERARIMQGYGEWTQATSRSGHLRVTGKLQSTSAATTLREKHGKRVLTDGPFAETKEQMGGYHVIECKDLDEAISIASRIPTLASGGAIEVRPLDPAYQR